MPAAFFSLIVSSSPCCSEGRAPRGAQIVLRQNARTSLVAGDNVGVDVETAHLHWFDQGGRLIAAAH